MWLAHAIGWGQVYKEAGMPTTTIIEAVQDRTGIESAENAHELIVAVLSTLNELDLGGQQSQLAGELPNEFGGLLRQAGTRKEQFGADEFINRVAQRMDISPEQSETWTRAALSLLVESVPTVNRESFRSALSEDIYLYTIWDV